MAYGQGRVEKQGRIWHVEYWHDGIRHRESSRSSDRQVALDLLRMRLDALGKMAPGMYRKATVADVLKCVLADYELTGKRTVRVMRYHVATWTARLGTVPAASVTYATLTTIAQEWQQVGASAATINRRMAALHRAYVLAERRSMVLRVPQVPRLREDNVRQGFLEPASFRHLLAAIRDTDLRDAIEWAYLSGARKAEVVALRWSWYDPSLRMIVLPASVTKNGKARAIPVLGPFVEVLERRAARRHPTSPLIFHRHGKPLGDFRKRWARAVAAVGLPDLIPHDLRRSAVRNLVRAGVDRRVAMKISGHEDEVVFSRYNITDAADLRAAASRLGTYLKESGRPGANNRLTTPPTPSKNLPGNGRSCGGKTR
jgi:integrase